MDLTQQVFLLLVGIAIGLVLGVIIGILIQRNRTAAPVESLQTEKSDDHYGTVTPDQIHTLAENQKESGPRRECPVCGHENPGDNLFCYDCGARLS